MNTTIAKNLAYLCDGIDVSIDGLKRTHEWLRGSSTFEKAINSIRLLKKAGASVSMGVTLMKVNFNELPQLCKLAESLDVGISVQPINPRGVVFPSGDFFAKELVFNESDIPLLEKVVINCSKYLLKSASWLYLRTVLDFIKGNFKRKCIAGYTTLTIDQEGYMYPCSFMKPVGKYERGKLREIWRSDKFNEARREMLNCYKCCLGCYEPDNITYNKFVKRVMSEMCRFLGIK